MPRGYPNYLSIDANGNITATFSGVVTGSLIIPEAAAAYTPANAVTWQDNTKTVREFLQGNNSGVAGFHELIAASIAEGDFTQDVAAILLDSIGPPNTALGSSTVRAFARDTNAGGHSANVKVVDSAGNSQFVEDGAGGTRKLVVQFGSGIVVWPAVAANYSNNVAIVLSYTYSSTYATVITSQWSSPGGWPSIAAINPAGQDGSHFNFQLWSPGSTLAAPVQAGYFWVTVGV